MDSPKRPVPDAIRLYEVWSQITRVGAWEMTTMRNEVPRFGHRPKVSIVMPVYDPKRTWLEPALDSVMSQAYPYWELCVCNDGSSEAHVKEVLDLYERLDGRIRVTHLEDNAGIGKATNEAFSLATGEFVIPMDHDDLLAPHALFEVVRLLQEHPRADLIYSDQERIDEEGNSFRPTFKPGWSPDAALGVNSLGHLSVYRRSLLGELGGWREGFDGAQDLDLMLRYTERTNEIYRLPRILYRWRMVEGSVATDPSFKPYTHERARRAIQDALARRNIRGRVLETSGPNHFRIEREIEGRPKVSVLIRVREDEDHARCVASLERRTSYSNYEVLLLATDSSSVQSLPGTKVVGVPEASTLLKMYNVAIKQAEGEYVLLLDPDLEALSEGWLETLLQHAQRPEVGAVGGKLVSREGRTLEAGLILNPEEREDLPQTFYRPFNQPAGTTMFVDSVRNCSAVSIACMMFRKEVFEAAGGFDAEHLEDTFGDVDLCLRLRELGCLIVYTPYAEFTRRDLELAPGLAPEQATYVRERWGEVLAEDPYYNPNLLWTAGDRRSVLRLIRFGDPPQRVSLTEPGAPRRGQ